MGKIETLLKIIFVSVFVLQGIDLILEKQKKEMGYRYYYEEYQQLHKQQVIPNIRLSLNLNSTQYDSIFSPITNLPDAPQCLKCYIQTMGATLLICSFFIILNTKILAFLSYIILSLWILFYSLIICNPYTAGDEKVAFTNKQKLYTNFLLFSITLALAFTPNVPKNPKLKTESTLNQSANTKTKSKRN